MTPQENTVYDYIVVGAGSAGCVLANRLSAAGDATVLLLEWGIADFSNDIRDSRRVLNVIHGESNFNKMYETEHQYSLAGRSVQILRGIVRGGCSSINGMIYVRGNRHDYDHWCQLGNEGWSFDEVLPFFRKSENYAGGASEYHGVGGPLYVQRLPYPSAAARAFIAAAANFSNKYGESGTYWDFNGPKQENGAGLYQVNITPDGKRVSAAAAFLDSIQEGRRNLTVKTEVYVNRILIENREGRKAATGLHCLERGEEVTYHANREVILSAGVFESPRLLMLSGIGPVEQLRPQGIIPQVDLPGVGQNLHDHLRISIYYRATGEVGQAQCIAEAGLFINTLDNTTTASPNLQYMFLAGMTGLAVDPPSFLIMPTLCKPHSRGHVSLRSANPTDRLTIQPNYLQCDSDLEVLLRGVQLAQELAQTSPLREYSIGRPFVVSNSAIEELPYIPGSSARNWKGTPVLEDLVSKIRLNATTVWHPVGTCKMGRDNLAVVDPQLKVYGVEGLRVADASIIPTIPSGNTNAVCIMIGEKAADFITNSQIITPPAIVAEE
jgi:choline dehydrogenase